jgi:hypothetical protein
LTYETYLREDPQASNRVEVEQRIGEMRTCSERERERASQAATPPPTRPATTVSAPKIETVASTDKRPAPGPSVAPIVLTGVGGILAAAGGVLYWQARVKFDHVKGTCPCPDGKFSGWQAATYTSYVLLATGGATLVGGVTWWFFDRRQSTASAYGVVVDPRGVSLVGAF